MPRNTSRTSPYGAYALAPLRRRWRSAGTTPVPRCWKSASSVHGRASRRRRTTRSMPGRTRRSCFRGMPDRSAIAAWRRASVTCTRCLPATAVVRGWCGRAGGYARRAHDSSGCARGLATAREVGRRPSGVGSPPVPRGRGRPIGRPRWLRHRRVAGAGAAAPHRWARGDRSWRCAPARLARDSRRSPACPPERPAGARWRPDALFPRCRRRA